MIDQLPCLLNRNASHPFLLIPPTIQTDISGFTAWSSVREATQVFQLLETVYNAFDKTARRLKVFKVETM